MNIQAPFTFASVHLLGGWRSFGLRLRGLRQVQAFLASRDVLHNPRESVVVRIGTGRKAAFGSQWRGYWPKKQRSGWPEAALSQTAGSYAGHP